MIEIRDFLDKSFNTGIISILKDLKENVNIMRKQLYTYEGWKSGAAKHNL